MSRSRFFTFIFNTVVILALTITVCELVLRLANRIRPSFIFYDSTYNRFRGKPFISDYSFKLNSLGFKDVEFSEDKGQTFRIVALGDSFAFGVVPYWHNYLTVLERNLTKDKPDVEVCNLGIPGLGPRDYLSVMVREGMPLEPDSVLLSFFVGNDFKQAEISVRQRKRLRKRLEYSYVASLFRYLFAIRPHYVAKGIHDSPVYDDTAPSFSDEKFLEIEKDRSKIFRRGYAEFENYLDASMQYLKETNRICRRHGATFAVIIIPDEAQVDTSLQSEIIRSSAGSSAKDWDFSMPNKAFSMRLKDAGIYHLDLYESFVDASREKRLYKPNDTHWNIAGNELAAAQIEEFLDSLLFQ